MKRCVVVALAALCLAGCSFRLPPGLVESSAKLVTVTAPTTTAPASPPVSAPAEATPEIAPSAPPTSVVPELVDVHDPHLIDPFGPEMSWHNDPPCAFDETSCEVR